MTTRVDAEDIATTRSERLLTVVLAAFLLIAGLWAYFNIDVESSPGYRDPVTTLSAPQRAALRRGDAAERRASLTRERVDARRGALVERREAYRTSLDAGRASPMLERRYRTAQARFEQAVTTARRDNAEARRARAAARPAQAAVREAERRESRRVDNARRHDDRVSAVRRLLLVLAALALSLWALGRLRRRRSRWLSAALAGVGASAVMALVMAIDYLTDYIDPQDVGVLVLALIGAAMTLVAIAALQRHLARRLPGQRVRKSQCPFCGFPVRGGHHCEGCGRETIAPCAACGDERRVGAVHCAACGAV